MLVMKTLVFLNFLGSLVLVCKGKDDGEYELTINNILTPGLNCFKQREGVTCPPVNRSCKKTQSRYLNETKNCVSRSDPPTHFYLFTPENKENPEYLHECGGSLPDNTLYNPERCTTIFVHGVFDGVCRTAVWREMKDQMFVRKNCNVILLDWSRENFPDVYDALNANKYVARRLGCVIVNIIEGTGASPKHFHLVGHSMGAHIAGLAAQHVCRKIKEKVGRITALDPANIGYFGKPPDQRLSCDDAEKVDAIHTNIGDCFPINIGYPENLAHDDFYPNGGAIQHSCYLSLLQSFLKGDILYASISLILSFCYHVQSLQYYKASINPCHCQFVGVQCEDYDEFKSKRCRTCNENGTNCAVMGMDWENYYEPSSSSRKFFLDTTLICPYCDNSGIILNGFPKNSEKKDPGIHCFESGKPALTTPRSMP